MANPVFRLTWNCLPFKPLGRISCFASLSYLEERLFKYVPVNLFIFFWKNLAIFRRDLLDVMIKHFVTLLADGRVQLVLAREGSGMKFQQKRDYGWSDDKEVLVNECDKVWEKSLKRKALELRKTQWASFVSHCERF